jgi:branched-chain amino acid aminotransferase
MSAMVSINGRIVDQAHAAISVFDHGFLYGEGVYEVVRTYGGLPFLFDRHMRRLRASASRLQLDVPLTDDELRARVLATMAAAALGADGREAYVRIMVTRGVGEITYDPGACPEPSIVVIAKPHVDPPASVYTDGVTVSLVGILRNHPGSVNPIIKSNNLLNNALGSQEAFRRGAFEGVMRNYRGEIAECTTSNIFIVKNGVAATPPLEAGLLAGITREFLFEVAAEVGIPMREQVLHDADLFGADESFLTSTTREIVPIVRVDDRVIGTGTPGPITRQLLGAFRERTSADVRTLERAANSSGT